MKKVTECPCASIFILFNLLYKGLMPAKFQVPSSDCLGGVVVTRQFGEKKRKKKRIGNKCNTKRFRCGALKSQLHIQISVSDLRKSVIECPRWIKN